MIIKFIIKVNRLGTQYMFADFETKFAFNCFCKCKKSLYPSAHCHFGVSIFGWYQLGVNKEHATLKWDLPNQS